MRGFVSYIAGAALGLVFAASLAGILSITMPLAAREPDEAPSPGASGTAPPDQAVSDQMAADGVRSDEPAVPTAMNEGANTDKTQAEDAAPARQAASEPARAASPPEPASPELAPAELAPAEPGPEPASDDIVIGAPPGEDDTTPDETAARSGVADETGSDRDSVGPGSPSTSAAAPAPNAAAPASPVSPAPPDPLRSASAGDASRDRFDASAAQARARTPAAAPEAVGRPAPGSSLPAFEANAAPFAGDRSAPLLAIALIDGGEDASGPPPGLARLSGPLAIVLAPSSEAQARASDLRTAGFEALIRLDADALRGAGVETAGPTGAGAMIHALAGDAGAVIGAAALGAPQIDEGLADDAVAAMQAAGFGLLDATTSDGDSTLLTRARAAGLPAAAAGRRIDTVGASAFVYQSLERAAYEARRTGAFVAVGELSPTVLAGVRRWLALKADGDVALAPLSAVMAKIAGR